MRHDVIPPLSDCVQLSVEQYRSKLYDIIRTEKAVRRQKAEAGDKMGERRASSHELSRAKELRGGQEDKGQHNGHLRSEVRKVNSEVNMRGQSASDNHGLNGGRPGARSLEARARGQSPGMAHGAMSGSVARMPPCAKAWYEAVER